MDSKPADDNPIGTILLEEAEPLPGSVSIPGKPLQLRSGHDLLDEVVSASVPTRGRVTCSLPGSTNS